LNIPLLFGFYAFGSEAVTPVGVTASLPKHKLVLKPKALFFFVRT
jgi:hypothetical protein